MISLQNLPIRNKVVAVMMIAVCAALLLAGAALLWLEISDFRQKLEREVASTARVIASNSVAAVSFEDRNACREMLGALRAEPKVLAAGIYSQSGEQLATYRRPDYIATLPLTLGPDGFTKTADSLIYCAPIRDDRENARIGTIFVETNFDELRERLSSFAKLLGIVLALSGAVGLALSTMLQRYIAMPILDLAGGMKRVSEDRDYSLRLRQTSRDELGELVAGFNAMVGQIQARDTALEAARETLEKRVDERTGQLRQEVAERSRAERDLAHSLALVTATLNSTADGILVVDTGGRVVSFNRRFVDLWKIPEDILITHDDQKLLAFSVSQVREPGAFMGRIAELYANPLRETCDLIEFLDGRVFERYSLPHRVEGACVGRVWSFRDITARTRAEERIREQADLLNLAQDAIVVRDMEDVTLFWNKGAERVFGWPATEAEGRSLPSLFKRDADNFAVAKQIVRTRGEWGGELTHVGKNGAEIRTESRWTLLRDSEGLPKAVLTINTDVTERKKLETQFLRAQRMESIGTLAGGIAHDLNNMLSPILMSVELLRLQEPDVETDSLLEFIESSASRGAALVSQILQFARGAEGKRIPVSLDRIVREICKIVRETFPKNISLRQSIAEDLWTVYGDATQLHQVILNLCVNARDAMPHGGELVVEIGNFTSGGGLADSKIAPAAGPHVLLRVKDSGSGIPPGFREKIFEPFFTTKNVGEGTGLGLSTAVTITKGHNGLLDFESAVGQGTTFTLCLPAIPMAKKDEIAETAMLPAGKGELVLLVDDEDSVRLVVKQTLESFGYRVLAERDGASAVETYRKRRSDIAIVITDMMMPGMDGNMTSRALKEIDPNVRIIAVSGLMNDARALQAAESGAVAVLRKPYSAESLLRTMRQLILEAPGFVLP